MKKFKLIAFVLSFTSAGFAFVAQADSDTYAIYKSDLAREGSTTWWVQNNVQEHKNLEDGYEYITTSGDREFSKFTHAIEVIRLVTIENGYPGPVSAYQVRFVPARPRDVVLDLGAGTSTTYRGTRFLLPIVDGREAQAINLAREVEYPKDLYRAKHGMSIPTEGGQSFPVVEFRWGFL